MPFQIAIIQFKPIRKNVEANIQLVQNLLRGIKSDLIVLPELSNSGYLYKNSQYLEPYSESQDGSGSFLSAIKDFAAAVGGMIITGYAEKAGDGIYNSSAAITKNGVTANYRKTHLFADENSLFEPGNSGFSVFRYKGVQIGMMICFDWIFPESVRTLALLGAQIIAHPANLVLPYCQDAMVTRSIENKVFTITANRIGEENLDEKHLRFTGGSQITAPDGRILYRGPDNKVAIHIVEIDPENALNKKISPFNDLFLDRRPQYYSM